jgi:hypothetical protein
MNKRLLISGVSILGATFLPFSLVHADLDTLQEFGNAATATSPNPVGIPHGADFTNAASAQYAITAAGTDIWGTSENGTFIYDSAAVESGDFSAIVRSVSIAADPLETLAGEWGRTGIMARVDPNAANSANVAHIRKSAGANGFTVLQGRRDAGADTERDNGEMGNSNQNQANGSVRNTPIWLGLHRINNRWFATWADDAGGSPGQWSIARERPNPNIAGNVYLGLCHQSHQDGTDGNGVAGNAHNLGGNTAEFDNFAVSSPNASYGVFPTTYSGEVTLNVDQAAVTGSSLELGDPVPRDVNWEVRFRGGTALNPGLLQADIYLQGSLGNQAAFNTMSDGEPDGTAYIETIRWASANYTQTNAAAANLFAQAVPGSFGGGQDNYGVNVTGEIYIPSDADRDGQEFVLFHDGVDDYCLLEVDGVVLIDNNTWSNLNGDGNGGGTQATFDCSDAKYDDGEWVSFRFGHWEGGGGDDAILVWDALDRTGGDSTTGATDANLNSYLGAGLGDGAQINFIHDAGRSDEIPAANFRYLGIGTVSTVTGMGQPVDQSVGIIPAGTLFIELYLDGLLHQSIPIEPTVDSVDFTAWDEVTINLADGGSGGLADVDETTITVLRDGVAIAPTSVSKVGLITTIIDTFVPNPFVTYVYTIVGTTTAGTGSQSFTLATNATSYAMRDVMRTGLSPAPNATVGWDYYEFDVNAALGRGLGGGADGYRDAQDVIATGIILANAMQPFINHNDPDSNGIGGGDWIPDLPILSDDVGVGDDQYVTYARTVITIGAGETGRYTIRVRGDDGYGLRVSGANMISLAGSAVNQFDLRDDTVFFPNFTGDSNAYAVVEFPTEGDYAVDFFGFEGGGGAYQEVAWVLGEFTAFDQSIDWQLLGDTSGFTPGNNSRWGVIPASVQPDISGDGEGWGINFWYGATTAGAVAVNNLNDTMTFLRETDAGTSTSTSLSSTSSSVLNHSDNAGGGGVFGGNLPYPDNPAGDNDRLAMVARARIVAPVDGDYTLQVRSDDGFLLRWVDQADFFYVENGAGLWRPNAPQEVYFEAGTGDSNTRATAFLTAGEHEILFVWWEGNGGSHFEISSAPGLEVDHGGTFELLSATPSDTNLYVGKTTPLPFLITSFVRDDNAETIEIVFNSEEGVNYAIDFSSDLGDLDNWQEGIDAQGEVGATSMVIQISFADLRSALLLEAGDPLPPQLFVRIRNVDIQPAP